MKLRSYSDESLGEIDEVDSCEEYDEERCFPYKRPVFAGDELLWGDIRKVRLKPVENLAIHRIRPELSGLKMKKRTLLKWNLSTRRGIGDTF